VIRRPRPALALSAALALAACVAVDDGRLPRDTTTTGGAGGSGGATPSETGGTGGTGDTGGTGGLDPQNPPDAGELPRPDVDAIFETGCATATVEAELPEVNMLFVLDRSESMQCNPPPTTASDACEIMPQRATLDPTKWEITREALADAIDKLPRQTRVGISYFSNDDGCGVHSRPRIPLRPLEPAQIAAIQASLASVTPRGATPLVGATILAYRHLHERALAGELTGQSFVVLLTDGEQTAMCSDEARCNGAENCTQLLVEEEVGKASGPGVGIRTFVIGVPGSEPAIPVLSAIAQQGLTAPADCDPTAGDCHFDMTKVQDLGAALGTALEQIVGRALSCDLPLPDAEDLDPERVNVVYSSSLGAPPRVVPRDDAACDGGADGWQYAQDGKSITLCGKACEDARKDEAGRMDVVLGCPVQGPD